MMKLPSLQKLLPILLLVSAILLAIAYNSESVPQLSGTPEGSQTLEGIEQPATITEANESAKPETSENDLTAEDLLPAEDKNAIEFANVAPTVDAPLSGQNFLTAGHLQGELSGASKNPNYGIRSEPPNPQKNVSPWMNTSIKPDALRRPLC